MKTIGIFGGTFDPPHKGHVKALTAFKNAYNFDSVLVIPTALPPHKNPCGTIEKDRLFMAKLAFECIDGISVYDYEISNGGKSYTINTLKHLKSVFPNSRLVLFTGSDMFLSIDRWFKADEILKMAVIACFSRFDDDGEALLNQAEKLRRNFNAACEIHDFSPLKISSSEIRDKILLNESCSELIPEKVYTYIKNASVYKPLTRSFLENLLQSRLSEKRFLHSLGVASSAVKLSKKYGANEKKAEIAGLLHDVTKNISNKEQILFCEKNGIFLDETERLAPQIIHAKTAEFFVKNNLGLCDEEILNAIRYHTTGRENISLPEKIIYVADFIEPTRDYSDVDYYRNLAEESLDKAFFEGMCWIIGNHLEKRGIIHPDTIKMYNNYIKFMSRKDK